MVNTLKTTNLQNVVHLLAFEDKAAAVGFKTIITPDAREKLSNRPKTCKLGRNKRTHLSHQLQQSHLSKIHRLAALFLKIDYCIQKYK
jgi:hypothetical protein